MKTIITAIAAAAALSFAGDASALTLSGDVNMVFAPASVQADARTNNNKALLFKESSNVALASDMRVEAYLPGLNTTGTAASRTLAAGRTVNSYFLHADVTGDNTPRHMTGSITFNDKILGVIFGNFSASDALVGAAGTAYETQDGHGLDFSDPNGDSFRISNNRMRIDFDFYVSGITDQIRIITAGNAPLVVTENPIPEPVTPALLAMGLGSLALRRRRTA